MSWEEEDEIAEEGFETGDLCAVIADKGAVLVEVVGRESSQGSGLA